MFCNPFHLTPEANEIVLLIRDLDLVGRNEPAMSYTLIVELQDELTRRRSVNLAAFYKRNHTRKNVSETYCGDLFPSVE